MISANCRLTVLPRLLIICKFPVPHCRSWVVGRSYLTEKGTRFFEPLGDEAIIDTPRRRDG
jgi:hypothetical protein